jgi:hypothetical protein
MYEYIKGAVSHEENKSRFVCLTILWHKTDNYIWNNRRIMYFRSPSRFWTWIAGSKTSKKGPITKSFCTLFFLPDTDLVIDRPPPKAVLPTFYRFIVPE